MFFRLLGYVILILLIIVGLYSRYLLNPLDDAGPHGEPKKRPKESAEI